MLAPFGSACTASVSSGGGVRSSGEQAVGPHVRAAGAGVVVDAEDRADAVVGEAGGEDVGGRVHRASVISTTGP